jgi:hypothetical protein
MMTLLSVTLCVCLGVSLTNIKTHADSKRTVTWRERVYSSFTHSRSSQNGFLIKTAFDICHIPNWNNMQLIFDSIMRRALTRMCS